MLGAMIDLEAERRLYMGVCRDEMPTQEYGSHIGPIGGPSCYPLWGGYWYSVCCCILEPLLCQQRHIFACSIALAFCTAQLRDSGMIEISVRSLECAVLECPHLIGHHSGHQRYPNILDILRYCDPGWTHKSNWINIYK